MALGNLQSAIEKLRKTIEAHRGYLAENETRTRQVLIDPLLRRLGWDVSNPNIVQLEYGVKEQRADYVLMSKGKPVAVIEAKPLGSNLKAKVIGQALAYAKLAVIDYTVVTDGDRWEMYDVFKKATLEESLLMKLELSQQPADKNAKQALAMRKPNLTSKEPVFDPPKSLFRRQRRRSYQSKESVSKRPKRASKRDKSPKPSKLLGRKSYSFDSGKRYPPHTKPSRLKIGDYVDVEVNFWRDVIHEVVVWLVDEGMLIVSACPILIGEWTFIDREGAMNRDGTPVKNPQKLLNGLILQRSNTTTHEQWDRLRKLLDQFNVDPSQIQVFYRSTGKASR